MKKFGLIGYPLGHSFSKKHFTAKFENENIDAIYNLYEIDDIAKIKNVVTDTELCGLNVTIPYKEKIIPFLDNLDITAQKIGAVNVVKLTRNENGLILTGYNSDATGFETSLLPLLEPQHTKALILGTGGASKAIRYILEKNNIASLFVSRTKEVNRITYDELDEKIMHEYKVIINASPVGTFPNSNQCPDIPYQYLTSEHLLFDVVYNPAITLFMKNGLDHGAKVINGENMLIGQAIAAWKIWNESK